MSLTAPKPTERRKNTTPPLTDDQFREFTMTSLEEGKQQFAEIKSDVAALTGHVNTLTGHIETLTTALAENTEFTKKTAKLSQKKQRMTRRIWSALRSSARRFRDGAGSLPD